MSLLPGTGVDTNTSNCDGRTDPLVDTQKSSPVENVPSTRDVDPSVIEM